MIDGQNNTIIGNISEEYNFGALYFNPSNGYVYFGSNNGLNTINSSTDAVENVTITPKIWNQIDPASIAYDPLSKSLYLGNSVVEIINSTNVFAKEVQTGGDSISIVFDSINGYMYVADDAYACAPNDNCTTGPRGSVSIISATSNTLVSALNFTSSMSGLADDSQNGNVLVAIYGNTSVIIDGTTNTILASIPSCSSAVFDPANGNFYATSSQGISVISGSSNKIVDTISLVQVTPADYYLVALPLTVGGVLLASGFILVTKRRKSSNVDSSLSTVASASVIKRPLGITFLDTTQLFLMNSYFQTTLESIGHYVKIDRIRMPPLLFCAGIQYLSLLRFLCRNVGRHNGSLFPFIFRIDEKFSSARESLMDYLRALAILLGHMSIRTIL